MIAAPQTAGFLQIYIVCNILNSLQYRFLAIAYALCILALSRALCMDIPLAQNFVPGALSQQTRHKFHQNGLEIRTIVRYNNGIDANICFFVNGGYR